MTNKVRGSIIDFPQASSTVPSSGEYLAGQVVFNTGSNSPVGWKCVVSGNPGTWVAFGEIILNNSSTWDPPSIAAGGVTSTVVAVAGAALGDFVSASLSTSLAGLELTGYVNAAGNVTVQLSNPTAGTVNVGSSALLIRVHKQ